MTEPEKCPGKYGIQPIEVWNNIVENALFSPAQNLMQEILKSWQYEKYMVEEEWQKLKTQIAYLTKRLETWRALKSFTEHNANYGDRTTDDEIVLKKLRKLGEIE